MTRRSVLVRAVAHAADYLEGLDSAAVAPTAGLDELREALGRALPEYGMAAEDVIDELVRDVDGGLVGSAGGRFFG